MNLITPLTQIVEISVLDMSKNKSDLIYFINNTHNIFAKSLIYCGYFSLSVS